MGPRLRPLHYVHLLLLLLLDRVFVPGRRGRKRRFRKSKFSGRSAAEVGL
jgi:hypothetical protein